MSKDSTPKSPKYPDIQVQLSGLDSNAFLIIGRVRSAIRREVGHDVAEAFSAEAMSGDYDHALQTCMRWVDVT